MASKNITVERACKTLNKLGFHVRDQGDTLMCFHTTKMFDAVIPVDGDVPDRVRLDQVIRGLHDNKGQRPARGGFASAREFSHPVTIRERGDA